MTTIANITIVKRVNGLPGCMKTTLRCITTNLKIINLNKTDRKRAQKKGLLSGAPWYWMLVFYSCYLELRTGLCIYHFLSVKRLRDKMSKSVTPLKRTLLWEIRSN
jgi:hypothetical protein